MRPSRSSDWRLSEPNSVERLQIIYKIAERCNLNCAYCYYYNLGDKTPLGRPALVSRTNAVELAKWVAQGCQALGIPTVQLSFHGGEPMLMRAVEFAHICDVFIRTVGPVADINFSIQSNGTLLTEGWLEALKRYQVHVGISVDGRRIDHDRFRLDHQGRSSFDVTEQTIRRLVEAGERDAHLRPGTISVLHHEVDYRATYRYLRGLGVRSMHFLLPDRNVDDRATMADGEAVALGAGLLDVFEAWLVEDDPDVHIRFVSETLGKFEILDTLEKPPQRRKSNQIIVARSDNTVAIDDSLIPALNWYKTVSAFPIEEYSLRDVFNDPIFQHLENERNTTPSDCAGCNWLAMCGGGDLENRYSKAFGFNNSSVYCQSYKHLYRGICNLLVNNGYPAAEARQRFGHFEDA
jgi:uncharacterized protein